MRNQYMWPANNPENLLLSILMALLLGAAGLAPGGCRLSGGGSIEPDAAPATCGNTTVEEPETCDGTNLGGQTCLTVAGLEQGVLACNSDCLTFDTSACHACGNGNCEFAASETLASCPQDCGWTMVSSGLDHNCALKQDGTVWCWGDNQYGQLGNGSVASSNSPVQVTGLRDVANVGVSFGHSCAVKTDGTVWCWGFNMQGQLGDGTTTDSPVPVRVTGLTRAISVAAGAQSCALLESGMVYCWGSNYFGGLGDGTNADSSVPVQVLGLPNAIAIGCGANHACAVRQTTTVWCWGLNLAGQLGDGSTVDSNIPVQVQGLNGARSVAGGLGFPVTHTCALKTDNTAWCWGSNLSGKLGDGTTVDSLTPVEVSGLLDVQTISPGEGHTCAVKIDGTVWCWGFNFYGQLGNATATDSHVPVVAALSDGVSIGTGGRHTCATVGNGAAWCWGANDPGQLGNGGTMPSQVPVQVVGP